MALLAGPHGRSSKRRSRRGHLKLANLFTLLLLASVGQSFVLPSRELRPRANVYSKALPGDEKKETSRSLVYLAVKDAIYAALFGAPNDTSTSNSSFEAVTGALVNFTSSAASGAASGVKAVEGAASSWVSWGLSKLQDLGSLLHISSGGAHTDAEEKEVSEVSEESLGSEAPEESLQVHQPAPAPAPSPLVAQAESALKHLFNDGSGFGAEPGDFFLFIKDYSWTLRYRVSPQGDSVDTERPLLLDWIKLRRPVQKPSQLLEIPSSDLFEWEVMEPPRHSGFMYQVTEVVGSGVEAVINFFKNRGPKLLVQQDGVSLVNEEDEEAEAPGKPVTHCWVQCLGLPFLPVLQYIAFLNGDQIVTDWRA